MAFSTAPTYEARAVNGGEQSAKAANIILTATVFQNGLKAGRFAKLENGSLNNLDGSTTPVIAGVVLRDATNAVSDGGTYDNTLVSEVSYQRAGLVTVDVVTGDTPQIFQKVFVNNTGATAGLATTNTGGVPTNAEFIREVKANVWLINLTPPNGDVPFPFNTAAIADVGNAGALPANRSYTVGLVTAGAETRTLAAPAQAGLIATLSFKTKVGDCVVTVTGGVNVTGNNTLTFDTAGEFITLIAVEVGTNLRWRVLANEGVALSTV